VTRIGSSRRRITREYLWALAAVVAATLAMLIVRDELGVLNVMLIYLLVVFVLALTTGGGPAAAMAVLSFLLFDVLFIPPYYTLTIAKTDHVLTVFVYLGIAVITAQLVARVQARTEAAIREQRQTALLADLNAALIGDVTVEEILNTIVERVVHVYGATACRILLPEPALGLLTVRASYPPGIDLPLDRQMRAMADWALECRAPAGLGQHGRRIHVPRGIRRDVIEPRGAPTDILYVPIATAERPVGVLEVHGRHSATRGVERAEDVLTSFANGAALALERGRMAEAASRTAALAQSDELKSALLAAVSHDLRTPLAVIKTATSSLRDPSVPWGDDERAEFIEVIDEETDRLTLMVSNLLDLSRIEGGVLRPDREWYDLPELIDDVADRLRRRAESTGHVIRVEIAPDVPLMYLDYVEIAQVLINLGENALRYAPAGTEITIRARPIGPAVQLSVQDEGPGIPPAEQARVFDKFYRVKSGEHVPGSGIGLAISKGIVETHGGRIWIESTPGAGSTFHFTLPIEQPREPEA
jgi:two-component system sensor histidine kinase KdpD